MTVVRKSAPWTANHRKTKQTHRPPKLTLVFILPTIVLPSSCPLQLFHTVLLFESLRSCNSGVISVWFSALQVTLITQALARRVVQFRCHNMPWNLRNYTLMIVPFYCLMKNHFHHFHGYNSWCWIRSAVPSDIKIWFCTVVSLTVLMICCEVWLCKCFVQVAYQTRGKTWGTRF